MLVLRAIAQRANAVVGALQAGELPADDGPGGPSLGREIVMFHDFEILRDGGILAAFAFREDGMVVAVSENRFHI